MKPKTIGECQETLDILIEKILNLKPESFQWFTRDDLPKTYLLNKWLSMKKDFTDVYLNMDYTHEELFLKYCGIQEHLEYYSRFLRRFLLFANNYDAPDYCANPFAGEHGGFLRELATGDKNAQGITAMQILHAWRKSERGVKLYLTHCCFGVKRPTPDLRTVNNANAA